MVCVTQFFAQIETNIMKEEEKHIKFQALVGPKKMTQKN